MIAGIFHEGSGLGDQLFRYVTVRTLAEKRGCRFGMIGRDDFKGKDFMSIDYGAGISHPLRRWNEKDTRDQQGNDIRSYDPEINFVCDDTVIDGSFEDDKYWRSSLPLMDSWFNVEPLSVDPDLCVVGFRGGEYTSIPDVFLPKEYYTEAMRRIKGINPNVHFEVHTDDPTLARAYFPDIPVVDNTAISHSYHSNMGFNWRSARYARYAILPNSAFFIVPRLLQHTHNGDSVTIAPRYWAGRNTHVWKRPACYYPEFRYI